MASVIILSATGTTTCSKSQSRASRTVTARAAGIPAGDWTQFDYNAQRKGVGPNDLNSGENLRRAARAAILMPALFAVGCAGPEAKLGRGISNTYECVRLGEMRRRR